MVNLIQRSIKNESLVTYIAQEKLNNFYECTIHNMYYSVYQKMKEILCRGKGLRNNVKISHGTICEKFKKYILKMSHDDNTNIAPLKKISILYRARIQYDYNEAEPIDENTYFWYCNIMKEINSYLDNFLIAEKN